ncbi:hypothetical protein JHK87_046139 [Glycine soja]|nr:hypothetical protein JHK87_046139 [Glycine soja]
MENRGYACNTKVGSAMDVDHCQQKEEEEEQEDPFLKFVDYARSELLSLEGDRNKDDDGSDGLGWSWIVSRILKTCIAYSSGVTPAILLSELSQAWSEQRWVGAPKKPLELINHLKKNHRRTKLPNTVTIDSIYAKNFLSLNSVLEAVIIDAFVLPGTNIHMLTLGDYWSSNIIDVYLHRRFYDLTGLQNGILKRGREIFLTGCYLRTATGGSGHPRLLPTEYLVILLDENQDDDAMLLGAQFCSDPFSSISLDAVNRGASYSLYARIEKIESSEIHRKFETLQRKQITLVDGDGVKLKFFLWGEQILLANLFRVGSMLALDKPYVNISVDCDTETSEDLCLEYGSETQLYLVPYIQHEEQVCVTLTPNRRHGSRPLGSFNSSQDLKFSQVSLPRDSQGTIDFSNYPFRSFVVDLRIKMTGISLYGAVTDIIKEENNQQTVFSLRIADTSGEIWTKLHFARFWSLGRVSFGHTVYISGLTCTMSKQKCLEVLWFENDIGASFINLSCLPALINSSCLHKLSRLTDIFYQTSYAQVRVMHYYLNVYLTFSLLLFQLLLCLGIPDDPSLIYGWACSFTGRSYKVEAFRATRRLRYDLTVLDDGMSILAWCTGQTAMDLLQISPEEFYELPEDEQVMYPSSLENERFMVALVNCKRDGCVIDGLSPDDSISWEITRACKL